MRIAKSTEWIIRQMYKAWRFKIVTYEEDNEYYEGKVIPNYHSVGTFYDYLADQLSDGRPSYDTKSSTQQKMSDAGLTEEAVEKILGDLIN